MPSPFAPLLEPESLTEWRDTTPTDMDAYARTYAWCGAPQTVDQWLLLTFDEPLVASLHRSCGHDDSHVFDGADSHDLVSRLDAAMAARLVARPKPSRERFPIQPQFVQLRMTTAEWLEIETSLCVMEERPAPSGCPRCDAAQ